MAKSNLIQLEKSGILRKIKKLSYLDDNIGIISISKPKIPKSLRTGLDTFAAGGFNEAYGLDIINRIISQYGMKAISATRENGVAYFTIIITSTLGNKKITIKYPNGEYI